MTIDQPRKHRLFNQPHSIEAGDGTAVGIWPWSDYETAYRPSALLLEGSDGSLSLLDV